MTIDERTLLYFMEIYQSGSIRAASERLGIAPSAISRRITNLETDLGARLFERLPRGLRPTPVADAIARHARERQHLSEMLADELEHLRGGQGGLVRLAAGEGYLSDVIDRGLSHFQRSHPGVAVQLETCSTDQVVAGLLDDTIDIGLAYNPPRNPAIEVVAEGEQPLCAILPPGHDLARWTCVTLEDLAPYPVALLDTRHGVRHLLDAVCQNEGTALSVRMECNSIPALRRFAASGLGAAILPRFAAEPELAAGRVVAVRLGNPDAVSGKSGLLVKRRRKPTPAVREMLRSFQRLLTSTASL